MSTPFSTFPFYEVAAILAMGVAFSCRHLAEQPPRFRKSVFAQAARLGERYHTHRPAQPTVWGECHPGSPGHPREGEGTGQGPSARPATRSKTAILAFE